MRACAPLRAGVVVGCLRSKTCTRDEWEASLQASDAAAAGDVAALERQLAMTAFSREYVHCNAARKDQAPLVACAYGVADAIGCVNDVRGSGSEANCVLLEVLVRGWPLMVLVTRQELTTGEELLTDYGSCHFGASSMRCTRACSARGAAHPRRSGASHPRRWPGRRLAPRCW